MVARHRNTARTVAAVCVLVLALALPVLPIATAEAGPHGASIDGPMGSEQTTNDETAVNVTVENATILTAPSGSVDELASKQAVAAARADARLSRTSTVTVGDPLVLRFESEQFATVLEARNGSTPTAKFRSLLNESDTVLQFRQTNHMTSFAPTMFAVDGGASHLVADRTNGTYYVVVDTATVDVGLWSRDGGFVDSDGYDRAIEDGDRWTTNFTIAGERLVQAGETWHQSNATHFETVEETSQSPTTATDTTPATTDDATETATDPASSTPSTSAAGPETTDAAGSTSTASPTTDGAGPGLTGATALVAIGTSCVLALRRRQ